MNKVDSEEKFTILPKCSTMVVMNKGQGANATPSFNLDEFSKKAESFYNKIKEKLEAEAKGKYAAIDFETERYWIGETASDALSNAKKDFPSKLFYLVQVGSTSTFTIQSVVSHGGSWANKRYDTERTYR